LLITLFASVLILVLRGGAVNDPARQYVCRPPLTVPQELARERADSTNVHAREVFRALGPERAGSGFWRPALLQGVECDRIGDGATLSRRQASRFASHLSARQDSNFLDIFLAKTEIGVMMFGNENFVQSRRVRNESSRPKSTTRRANLKRRQIFLFFLRATH
jgi:hypothetical protein